MWNMSGYRTRTGIILHRCQPAQQRTNLNTRDPFIISLHIKYIEEEHIGCLKDFCALQFGEQCIRHGTVPPTYLGASAVRHANTNIFTIHEKMPGSHQCRQAYEHSLAPRVAGLIIEKGMSGVVVGGMERNCGFKCTGTTMKVLL